ncbi:LYAR-type C2HC zinc finger containing protein, putative [Angomonas deanei]|uniref:LYAR-type C2HC zinc finger containing protein, putative n=1 Tax=Angomonas deanei TaxID=59799 RepID=A0A7G2CG75_9TRYP|nr:LYAR-type C2HC zinc finger containing protein, putative [Angomonas deanei]
MVSFTCGNCQDVIKKPKVLSHSLQCHSNLFICVDCMMEFDTESVKGHTSCVTEVQKYQGKWKPPTKNSEFVKEKNDFLQRPPKMNLSDLDTSSDDDDDKKTKNNNQKKEESKKRKREEEEEAVQKEKSPEENENKKKKKHYSPLLLPVSTADTAAYLVPSFPLTEESSLLPVVQDLLETAGGSLSEKELARQLVACYTKKISKQLRQSVVQEMKERRVIKIGDDGVCTAGKQLKELNK